MKVVWKLEIEFKENRIELKGNKEAKKEIDFKVMKLNKKALNWNTIIRNLHGEIK